MDGFRFILENPYPNASTNKQRKRARLVTACDSCRVKKIKCQQTAPNARCQACKAAKSPCLFGDRDRYQAERGVSCTWNPPGEDIPASPDGLSLKRKMSPPFEPASELWRPSGSSSAQPSRSATPAGPQPTYRYFHPELHGRSSSTPPVLNDYEAFPRSSLVPSHNTPSNVVSHDHLPLFDPSRPRFPHPQRMRHLGVLFFDQVGCHFPFLDRQEVLHRIEQRTCSAILANCIAGLGARFANPTRPDHLAGAPFYDMAKTLAAHVVSVPSVEALHALICITWVEYGSGLDAGFWMYSRMAIAMCLDLGLGNESTIQVAATPEVRSRLRTTWWMVVCTADIAASWATGRPAALDLDQFDTALPQATDDASVLFRNVVELFLLRGRLNRVLDAHLESQGDSSLDWDLSELQADLNSMSKRLSSSLLFTEDNLIQMREQRVGHLFLQMHLLIDGVSALVNRPSLLTSYGLPVPTEGARVEAARLCAKGVVNILMTVEDTAPHALRDPFLDLPILVAARTFIAESAAHSPAALPNMSPRSLQLARQWGDTFLNKCKDALIRISSLWGGVAAFDTILEQHGGTLADDLQLGGSSSVDLFTVPSSSQHWLIHPSLVDDGASDTSSSFRSSSHELSPRLAPIASASKYASGAMGPSPLVRGVDEPGPWLGMNDPSYRSDLFVPESLDPDADLYKMSSSTDEPCALHIAMDTSPAHTMLSGPRDIWARKDDISLSGLDKLSSPQSLFSPLPWISRT